MDAFGHNILPAAIPFANFAFLWLFIGRYSLDLCYLMHAFGAVVLGLVSIYQGSNGNSLEHLLVRYSFGYFVGHGIEMVRQKSASPTMIFHHILALTLLVGVMLNPEFVDLKATSNVLLTEFSTLFLYMWEKHPSEQALGAFVVSYFLSRGIVLGYFLIRVFTTTNPEDPASKIPVGTFHYFTLLLFTLNALYFSKILVPSVPGHLKRLSESKQQQSLGEMSM